LDRVFSVLRLVVSVADSQVLSHRAEFNIEAANGALIATSHNMHRIGCMADAHALMRAVIL